MYAGNNKKERMLYPYLLYILYNPLKKIRNYRGVVSSCFQT